MRAAAPRSEILKRGFDLLLSGVGLVLSAPVWGVIALAVKLHDGGPVFFPQERWGRHQSRFGVLKFRTMIPNANAAGGQRPGDGERPAHHPRSAGSCGPPPSTSCRSC